MKKDSILDDLEIIMGDRLNDALNKSTEYQQAITIESNLYELLNSKLPEQYHELLEKYCEALSETTAICEKIAYRQGLRDLTHILFQDEDM